MTPLIETKKLTHIYSEGTPFEHVAVKDVDFTASRGEFIGIIGHTGSGKSTFVQHLNGLLKPTSGSVLVEGEEIFSSAARTRQVRSKVGLVFQYPEYQLFEETVRADIAYGPKNMKLSKEEIEQRVLEAADFVGLDPELLDKSPFDLSGGQKRRAAIAGVIAMRPDVLILDEPTAGLDPRGREEIIFNIRRYHTAVNGTVIYITHSMEDIARFATRLVVFNKGSIAMDGEPAQVFRHVEELESMGLTVPSVTKVMSLLKARGIPVEEGVTASRARHMYRLFNEAAKIVKTIDPSRPVAMCNGDLVFLDIIVEECKDIDIFGVNSYRGDSFDTLFQVVKEKYGKPLMFTEFGADAFEEIVFDDAKYDSLCMDLRGRRLWDSAEEESEP